jgi:hypothetical protein
MPAPPYARDRSLYFYLDPTPLDPPAFDTGVAATLPAYSISTVSCSTIAAEKIPGSAPGNYNKYALKNPSGRARTTTAPQFQGSVFRYVQCVR